MSGINNRTVFAEFTKDSTGKKYLRFADWARVETDLGPMAEPFDANGRTTVSGLQAQVAYDPEDQIAMMNSLEFVNSDALPTMLSGGKGTVLHGGNTIPRVGR